MSHILHAKKKKRRFMERLNTQVNRSQIMGEDRALTPALQ